MSVLKTYLFSLMAFGCLFVLAVVSAGNIHVDSGQDVSSSCFPQDNKRNDTTIILTLLCFLSFLSTILLLLILYKMYQNYPTSSGLTAAQMERLSLEMMKMLCNTIDQADKGSQRGLNVSGELRSSCSSIGVDDNENQVKESKKEGEGRQSRQTLCSTPIKDVEDTSNNPLTSKTNDKIDQVLNFLEHMEQSQDIIADGICRVLNIWRYSETEGIDFWAFADDQITKNDTGDRFSRRVRKNLLSSPRDRDLTDVFNGYDQHVDQEDASASALPETTILDTSDSILIPDNDAILYEEVFQDSFSSISQDLPTN